MRGWRIGQVRGIVLEINYTWLIIFGLFFVSLSTTWFPQAYPELAAEWYWGAGLFATLLLFASVLAHELAHSLVAKASGIEVSRITLFVFGGVAQMKSEPKSPADELKIAGAGPVMSVLLAVLFGSLWLMLRNETALVGEVLKYLALANGILAVFNMVPAFPLDGGRVLRAAIWRATGDLQRSTAIASTAGQIFGLLLMTGGFWSLLAGATVSGLWYLALGWLLMNAAQSSYQRLQMEDALGDEPVSALMSQPAATIPADVDLKTAVEDYFLSRRHAAFPVLTEEGDLAGMLSLEQVRSHDRDQWPSTRVRDVMEPVDPEEMTIDPTAQAVEALLKMAEKGRGRLMVTDSLGDLVGIISQSDILRLVRIKAGLEG